MSTINDLDATPTGEQLALASSGAATEARPGTLLVIDQVVGDELVIEPLCDRCERRPARVGRLCETCDERLATERADFNSEMGDE